MATTANRGYPYPIASDPPAGHTQIAALANAVDADMNVVDKVQAKKTTADITVTASTTLVNATGLSASVIASTAYMFRAVCFYNAATGGDFKPGWTLPAGASVQHYGIIGLDGGATTATGVTNFGATGTLSTGGSGGELICLVEGTILTAATPGTFQFQFAQAAASGSTILRAYSTLLVIRCS